MGWNDHLHDYPQTRTICKLCKKQYKQWIEYQVPGFRSRDYDICPYCGTENGSSMEIEFHNKKLEE